MNAGAYSFVEPRLARIIEELGLKDKVINCHARRSLASTAIGVPKLHAAESKALLDCLLRYKWLNWLLTSINLNINKY